MNSNFSKKPMALAMGAAFALTGLSAQASVFQAVDLGAGYMVAQAKGDEAKCGENKCGAKCVEAMQKKGKSAYVAKAECDKLAKEGKCGGDEKKAKDAEGKCGEGKCGEGKCGGKN